MVPFHVKSNENNIFSPRSVQKFDVVTICRLSIYYKIILSLFYNVQISTISEKFIVLSIVLAKPGFARRKENKKGIKITILESNRECAQVYSVFGVL